MSRASRLKLLRSADAKAARCQVKQLFRGTGPTHFVFFRMGEFATAQTHHGPLSKELQKRIAEVNIDGLNAPTSARRTHGGDVQPEGRERRGRDSTLFAA